MNQIISFKPFLIDKVLDGTKDLTTRIETDYRLKLDVGDTIYIYTGIRTKNAKKYAEAVITNREIWNQEILKRFMVDLISAPICKNWQEFRTREGFETLQELIDYFQQKEYTDKNLITYEFKLKTTMERYL